MVPVFLLHIPMNYYLLIIYQDNSYIYPQKAKYIRENCKVNARVSHIIKTQPKSTLFIYSNHICRLAYPNVVTEYSKGERQGRFKDYSFM